MEGHKRPENPAQPHNQEEISKVFSTGIKDKGTAEFLSSELTNRLAKLTNQTGNEETIKKLLKPYVDMVKDPKVMDALLFKLLAVINEEFTKKEEELVTDTALVENTEKPVVEQKQPENILTALNIQAGSVFFDHNENPIMIKKVNAKEGLLDVVDSKGVYRIYKVDNKIDDGLKDASGFEVGHLVLRSGKINVGLSLASPIHTEHKGVDLEHETGEFPIDVGEVFLDGKNKPWTITKILERKNNVIVQIKNEAGETDHVFLRDWMHKNNQDVLKTLGDRTTLLRTIKPQETIAQPPTSVETSETNEPEEHSYSQLTFPGDTESFTIVKNEFYKDDDGAAWRVLSLDSVGEEFTITIVNDTGEEKEINVASWDAFTQTIVITDEAGKEHLFEPITAGEVQSIKEIAEENAHAIPEIVEISEAEKRRLKEIQDLEDLLKEMGDDVLN